MDIYGYLKKDHKKVKQLMDDLLETDNIKERVILFDKIKYELLLHAKTEQDSFYKKLENQEPTQERIEEAEDEHKEIEKYLKKLSECDFESEEWIEKFGEFRHSVIHHVKEEEEGIFKKAKQVLSEEDAVEVMEEMKELKQSPKYQKKAQD